MAFPSGRQGGSSENYRTTHGDRVRNVARRLPGGRWDCQGEGDRRGALHPTRRPGRASSWVVWRELPTLCVVPVSPSASRQGSRLLSTLLTRGSSSPMGRPPPRAKRQGLYPCRGDADVGPPPSRADSLFHLT